MKKKKKGNVERIVEKNLLNSNLRQESIVGANLVENLARVSVNKLTPEV